MISHAGIISHARIEGNVDLLRSLLFIILDQITTTNDFTRKPSFPSMKLPMSSELLRRFFPFRRHATQSDTDADKSGKIRAATKDQTQHQVNPRQVIPNQQDAESPDERREREALEYIHKLSMSPRRRCTCKSSYCESTCRYPLSSVWEEEDFDDEEAEDELPKEKHNKDMHSSKEEALNNIREAKEHKEATLQSSL